jgi:hypothetical protein
MSEDLDMDQSQPHKYQAKINYDNEYEKQCCAVCDRLCESTAIMLPSGRTMWW